MNFSKSRITAVLMMASCLTGSGCVVTPAHDDRPPTDVLVDGNSGLQAKDVGAATDQMANDLLALPALNSASRQWTIVITDPINQTTDPYSHYNVFSNRLKGLVLSKSQGRVALIDNKDAYHDLQNKELEAPADNMGQGGAASGHPAGIQPDYALQITVDEMPNQATSYYLVSSKLTNLKTRQLVWGSSYEIQTARD